MRIRTQKKKIFSILAVAFTICIVILSVGCKRPAATPPKPDCSKGHTPEIVPAKSATCIETGLTEGKRCAVCKEILTAQESIDATGVHAYENGACKYCKKSEPIPSKGLAFTLSEDGESYELSGIGDCTDLNVVVPRTYEGKPVTKISDYAFAYCSELLSIEILEGNVTSIGREAFFGCNNLSYLSIPRGVTSIGSASFVSCNKLEEVILPDTLTNIDHQAFFQWDGLKRIKIPSGVTEISRSAFSGCTNLETIVLPDTLISIDFYAFDQCYSLKELIIPDKIQVVKDFSSYELSSLEHISIGSGVTSLSPSVFSNAPKLSRISVSEENPVYHSNGTCLIETNTKTLIAALPGCTIPSDGSVTRIGEYAFLCSPLHISLEIPEGVTTIDECAFIQCTSLAEVTLPSTLRETGVQLFLDCSSLTSLTIRDGITKIGWSSFSNIPKLASFSVPSTVTVIESLAFQSCTSLTSITLPKSLVEIQSEPFLYCGALTEIYYEGTVEEWAAIYKWSDWNLSHWSLTVHCTNGDVTEIIS